jgi:uncharacterized membrane protein YbhN (UPF0104 family)
VTDRPDRPSPLGSTPAERTPDTQTPRTHRRWLGLVRATISLGVLGLVVLQAPDFEWGDLLPEPTTSTFVWLAVAAGLMLTALVMAALRWWAVTEAIGPEAPLRRLVSHTFAGQFVSNALPSTIGGDVVRVARLGRDTGETADAFASVLLERLTGWLVLPLLTFAGFSLDPSVRGAAAATQLALVVGIVTLVALIGILVAADHPRLLGRFAQSDGWRRFAGSVHLGTQRLRRHPRSAFVVLGAGIIYQGTLVAAVAATSRVVGMDVPVLAVAAVTPAVLMLQVLPIGLAGLGVREGAFALFLAPLGVPAEQAVALGLLVWLLTVVTSLAGAPAFLLGGPRQSPTEAP